MFDLNNVDVDRFSAKKGGKKDSFMGKNTKLLLGFVAGTIVFILILYAIAGAIVYFMG